MLTDQRACVRVCARVCVRACVRASTWACFCVCVCYSAKSAKQVLLLCTLGQRGFQEQIGWQGLILLTSTPRGRNGTTYSPADSVTVPVNVCVCTSARMFTIYTVTQMFTSTLWSWSGATESPADDTTMCLCVGVRARVRLASLQDG